MLRFVVTAIGMGPATENTATYIAKSASSIIVGPEMVPPGRMEFLLKVPLYADISVVDALDGEPAAGMEELRKFIAKQLSDFVGIHRRSRHTAPPCRSIRRLGLRRHRCDVNPAGQALP